MPAGGPGLERPVGAGQDDTRVGGAKVLDP